MPAAGEGRQPELRHRVVAAAGASIVSALLVNPLDVVKTRIQSASVVTDRPLPSCLLTRIPGRYPVRWARPASLADCQSKLPASPVGGCTGGISSAAQPGGFLQRSLLGQLPMSSCACALKVADLGPGSLGSAESCHNARPYRPVTARGVLRDIVQKEGLPALWRGTDTAILASIPMVAVYMPLYDHLLQQSTPVLGGYAPMIAGSSARTLAVLLVGPLELVRTRQQGSTGGARTAWGAVRDTLRETAAAAAAGSGTGTAGAGSAAGGRGAAVAAAAVGSSGPAGPLGLAGALRTMPRLWTGVAATLARDVPFSAIYWGLLERVRGGLLARWEEQSRQLGGGEGAGAVGNPSGRAVLAANFIAGSSAGAVAAVVTTPFDVVKTRLQVGDVRTRTTGAEVARRVLREEGLAGLFRGWGPRAVRTAPACAVVVASYEVLKLLV